MPFIPVDKAIEGILVYNLFGQRCINTLWFKCATNPTLQDLQDTLTVLKTFWSQLRTASSNELSIEQVEAHDRTAQVGLFLVDTNIISPSGGQPLPSSPGNVSLTMRFNTGYGGRSARGRNYCLGIPSQWVANNEVGAPYNPAVLSYYNAIITEAGNVGLTWCVASRYHNHAPRPLGVMTPITGVATDWVVDSQRRRLTGRGQ